MNKVRHADSYKLTVDRYYNRFYISAKHFTKNHPDGVTLLYNKLLNEYIGV